MFDLLIFCEDYKNTTKRYYVTVSCIFSCHESSSAGHRTRLSRKEASSDSKCVLHEQQMIDTEYYYKLFDETQMTYQSKK